MTRFEDLNDGDRLALCDIAWFIKGFRAASKEDISGLDQDHEDTLKRVISVISDKVSADKKAPPHDKEMLEALESLSDILKNHYGDDPDETPLIDRAFEVMKKAKVPPSNHKGAENG